MDVNAAITISNDTDDTTTIKSYMIKACLENDMQKFVLNTDNCRYDEVASQIAKLYDMNDSKFKIKYTDDGLYMSICNNFYIIRSGL